MKREFQIGDRVVCVAPDYNIDSTKEHLGKIGTIVGHEGRHHGHDLYQVEYDERFRSALHNCAGHLDGPLCSNRGWNHYAHELELFYGVVVEVNDLL